MLPLVAVIKVAPVNANRAIQSSLKSSNAVNSVVRDERLLVPGLIVADRMGKELRLDRFSAVFSRRLDRRFHLFKQFFCIEPQMLFAPVENLAIDHHRIYVARSAAVKKRMNRIVLAREIRFSQPPAIEQNHIGSLSGFQRAGQFSPAQYVRAVYRRHSENIFERYGLGAYTGNSL